MECPNKLQLREYVWEKLLDTESELAIAEHINECPKCLSIAQEEDKLKDFWENYGGEFYDFSYQMYKKASWSKEFVEVLKRLNQRTSGGLFVIKKYLKNLLMVKGDGVVGPIIQVTVDKDSPRIKDFSNKTVISVTDTSVQGSVGTLKGDIYIDKKISIYVKVEPENILIRFGTDVILPPSLVIINEDGKAVVGKAEINEESSYSISFKNIKPGKYFLVFEPEHIDLEVPKKIEYLPKKIERLQRYNRIFKIGLIAAILTLFAISIPLILHLSSTKDDAAPIFQRSNTWPLLLCLSGENVDESNTTFSIKLKSLNDLQSWQSGIHLHFSCHGKSLPLRITACWDGTTNKIEIIELNPEQTLPAALIISSNANYKSFLENMDNEFLFSYGRILTKYDKDVRNDILTYLKSACNICIWDTTHGITIEKASVNYRGQSFKSVPKYSDTNKICMLSSCRISWQSPKASQNTPIIIVFKKGIRDEPELSKFHDGDVYAWTTPLFNIDNESNQTVNIEQVVTKEGWRSVKIVPKYIDGVMFTPDASRIITVSGYGIAKLWDVKDHIYSHTIFVYDNDIRANLRSAQDITIEKTADNYWIERFKNILKCSDSNGTKVLETKFLRDELLNDYLVFTVDNESIPTVNFEQVLDNALANYWQSRQTFKTVPKYSDSKIREIASNGIEDLCIKPTESEKIAGSHNIYLANTPCSSIVEQSPKKVSVGFTPCGKVGQSSGTSSVSIPKPSPSVIADTASNFHGTVSANLEACASDRKDELSCDTLDSAKSSTETVLKDFRTLKACATVKKDEFTKMKEKVRSDCDRTLNAYSSQVNACTVKVQEKGITKDKKIIQEALKKSCGETLEKEKDEAELKKEKEKEKEQDRIK